MPLQLDIRAVLRQKAPKAHIPEFVIRYLERITHIRQMNAFLRKYPDKKGYEFIRLVLDEELGCTASLEGLENIPTDDRPVIFVSNHPLGGLDGMIIAQMIHEARQQK
ncbi:MAG: glycerol acyltransferase, partial [Paludibacteraceae bacterium]|nr:glycerol acyltransferase [Paludibacteraceae bacterium]